MKISKEKTNMTYIEKKERKKHILAYLRVWNYLTIEIKE